MRYESKFIFLHVDILLLYRHGCNYDPNFMNHFYIFLKISCPHIHRSISKFTILFIYLNTKNTLSSLV